MVLREEYFDTDGNPIAQARNQAGVEYGYDIYGNRVLLRYLGKDGKLVELKDGYSIIRREYNSKKQLLEESYYDREDSPINTYGCYAKFWNVYTASGQLSLTYYTDAEGKHVSCGSSCFHEFLQNLRNCNDITIFISAKDEATNALTETLLLDLKSLGIQTDRKKATV